jgi:SAM-dependent methyltransferase
MMAKKSEWFNEFFDDLYAEVLANTHTDERSFEEARKIEKLLKVRKSQRVLDIPCGMGRLTLPLAKMGLAITGVDFAAAYLRRGQRHARLDDLDVRFIKRDMREIDFDSEFHAAFNWFGSFGYFNDAENLEFCRRALRSLRPGGRFLVEGIYKPWLVRNLWKKTEDDWGGVRVVQRNRWDPKHNRIHSAWELNKGRRHARRRVSMRIYSGGELRDLLRRAGFNEIQLFDRESNGRLTNRSRRLAALAVRPRK